MTEQVFGKVDEGTFSHPGFTASEVEDICNQMCEGQMTLYDVVGDNYIEEMLIRDLLAAALKTGSEQ